MEYKGVQNYHPDWDMEHQFLVLDLHSVLDLDSTLNSHPIVQTANRPEQINEMFDAISYKKGASILRMLENFMGDLEVEFIFSLRSTSTRMLSQMIFGRLLRQFHQQNYQSKGLWTRGQDRWVTLSS